MRPHFHRRPTAPAGQLNPLDLIAFKQKVGLADAETIALPLLIHFDGAHRGHGSVDCHQFLTLHLIIASAIASKTGLRQFHNDTLAAYQALVKAAERPTKELDLTTDEYRLMRKAFTTYLRVLPGIEIATMLFAAKHAADVMA